MFNEVGQNRRKTQKLCKNFWVFIVCFKGRTKHYIKSCVLSVHVIHELVYNIHFIPVSLIIIFSVDSSTLFTGVTNATVGYNLFSNTMRKE